MFVRAWIRHYRETGPWFLKSILLSNNTSRLLDRKAAKFLQIHFKCLLAVGQLFKCLFSCRSVGCLNAFLAVARSLV